MDKKMLWPLVKYLQYRPAVKRFADFIHQQLPKSVRGSLGLRRPLVRKYTNQKPGDQNSLCYSPRSDDHIPSHTRPNINNPVLTSSDVTDWGTTDFVADPFIIQDELGIWHMFMEVFNADREPQAAIGHATSKDHARTWNYDCIVLDTGKHLSFPYVFEWKDSHYLIPEMGAASEGSPVTLFKARDFPYRWSKQIDLISPDHPTEDHFVFHYNDRWWALVGDWSGGNNLHAYHSDQLNTSGWTPHRENPIVTNRPKAARPAGRPIINGSQILLFFQDCRAMYGHKVRAYEVTELSPDVYCDRELPGSPVIEPRGRIGWNSGRMHHIDAWHTERGWVCAVDGDVSDITRLLAGDRWSIGIYTNGEKSDVE